MNSVFNFFSRISASLWFLLEVNYNAILCTAWCPSLRNSVKQDSKLSNFVGILAVGGMNGPISLYGLVNPFSLLFITIVSYVGDERWR